MSVPLALVLAVDAAASDVESTVAAWSHVVDEAAPGAHLILVDSAAAPGSTLERLARPLRISVARGKPGSRGSAVRAGYRAALNMGARWVAQADGDRGFAPDDFAGLWAERDAAEAIIAERTGAGGPFRRFGAALAALALRLVFRRSIPDPGCGLRLLRADLLAACLNVVGTNAAAPNVEISILAARWDRWRLKRVPVDRRVVRAARSGQSSLAGACVAARTVWDLGRLRMRLNNPDPV